MYKANDGRGNYAKTAAKAVSFNQNESAIERRERILAEKRLRESDKNSHERELRAWKYLANLNGKVVI